MKGTSSFRYERTESSRLMRGARIPGDEYLPEQRPQQVFPRHQIRQREVSVGGDGAADVISAGV